MKEKTTFERLKDALLELLDGYPSYMFFGKIEYYLKSQHSSLEVLKKDGIIEFASKSEVKNLNKKLTAEDWERLKKEGKKEPIWYRLASKGVDLAISMINQDNSKRVLYHAQKTSYFTKVLIWFTKILVVLGIGTLTYAFIQSIISLWF